MFLPFQAKTNEEGEVKIGQDCDRLLRFMWRIGHFICVLYVIIALRRPDRPVLLSSLFEDPKGLRIRARVLLVIPHIYVWWTLWAMMHLLALHCVASVYCISNTSLYLKLVDALSLLTSIIARC